MILILLALPLGMALVVWLLRRAPILAAPLSAATCLAMAVLAIASSRVAPLVILGRTLSLSQPAAGHLALLAALTALVLLYAYRLPQGELGWPLALATLGFLCGALLVQSATIAAILLLAAGILAVMLASSGRERSAMVASRALTLVVIGGLLMLVAAWSVESSAAEVEEQSLSATAGVVLILGLALFAGLVPFFVWAPPIYEQTGPLATLLLCASLSTVAFLRFSALYQSAAPLVQVLLGDLLLAVGIATTLVGSVGALTQRSVSRILAYAALADLGVISVGIALRNPDTTAAAMLHLAYRGVAIVTVAMAAGVLRLCFGGDHLEQLRGAVRRAPLAIIGLVVGGFSLAGLPPMAGFASRFGLYRALTQLLPLWTAVLALSAIGPAWAVVRCVIAAIAPAPLPGSRREPIIPGVLIALLCLFLLVAGLVPQALAWLPGQWFEMLMASSTLPGV